MSRTLDKLMSRDVKTLRADQTLLDAMSFMRERQVRHIPIVDAAGALVGLVTDRDIKRATPSALLNKREDWERTVRDTTLERVMSRELATGQPETSLKEATRQFVEEKIGCMPILAEGELVGIVTAHDLLKALHELL